MKTTKLVIGIISIVLFCIIAFQSCATGVANALTENAADMSGSGGIIVAFAFLIGGIVGICTRKSKGGAIFTGYIYAFAALVGTITGGTFKDLEVWSYLAFAFAIVFFASYFLDKSPPKGED